MKTKENQLQKAYMVNLRL